MARRPCIYARNIHTNALNIQTKCTAIIWCLSGLFNRHEIRPLENQAISVMLFVTIPIKSAPGLLNWTHAFSLYKACARERINIRSKKNTSYFSLTIENFNFLKMEHGVFWVVDVKVFSNLLDCWDFITRGKYNAWWILWYGRINPLTFAYAASINIEIIH